MVSSFATLRAEIREAYRTSPSRSTSLKGGRHHKHCKGFVRLKIVMRRAGEAHCRVPPAPCSLLDRKRDRFFHLSEISSRKLAERLLDVDSSRTGVDGLRAELAKLRRTRSADNAFNPSRLESLNEVFNQTTEHFTTVRPLLAEIQREYFSVVTGILNVQKEKIISVQRFND
ncbi:hypothetical protein BC829DRAFT_157340 [Chytridium lagenaria]|nr:hypothetical protein BC829DRAFT_157340 [Chytridium lagenaria]